MARRLALTLALGGLLALSAPAAELHVSPQGDDRNPGTAELPLRTLGAATARLRPGDVCRVWPGVYRESLTALPSGTPERPITLRSERPHGATLSGLEPVTGWQRVRGDLWRAPAPGVLPGRSALFAEGEPCVRARWPNRRGRDLLDWEAAAYDPARSSERELVSDELPDRPDGHWTGARLWVMGGAKWTSWSVRVTGYDARRRALAYSLEGTRRARAAAANFMALARPQGGRFVLLGDEREIDAPWEFYVDEEARTVWLQVPPGRDPNRMAVELQVRAEVVSLAGGGVSHLRLEGFRTIGGGMDWGRAEAVVLENLRCAWLGASDGGDTGYGIDHPIGIRLSGRANTVRDSEIAYSHGNGLVISGQDNRVVNCHIHHTDFLGSYDAPLRLSGARNLVSHCTIHDTGRDCLLPSGAANVIQYCDISRMGRICHDLGATYSCASDGGGTEYHHNWIHDNLAAGTRMGIYLDNFTCNNLIYKNVVWNIAGCDIRLNRPGQNNFVINNTMLGKCGNWGRWQTDWLYNCAYLNNAVAGDIAPHPQIILAGNLTRLTPDRLSLKTFRTFDGASPQAVAIPGVTGDVPHVGAYAPGESWRPGHDFGQRPDPQWRLLDTPLRNLLANATFGRGLQGWRLRPDGKAGQFKHWGGGITMSYAERHAIIGGSVALRGEDARLEQDVAETRAGQRLQLSVWHRLDGGAGAAPAAIRLMVLADGAELAASREFPSSDVWQQATLDLETRGGAVTVSIAKVGPGVVWVDSASLIGSLPGLEPKLPGLAPVSKAATRPAGAKARPAPRRTAPLAVPAGNAASDAIAQAPGRVLAAGHPARLEVSHDGAGLLTVAIEVPLEQPLPADTQPVWTESDGVECCLSDSDNNARHPVFVLHGFPNGTFEVSDEAGAPREESARLAADVRYRATVTPDRRSWRGEFAIPLRSIGLAGVPGTLLDFNAGVFRRESRQWLQWAGTPSQTWLVREAGQLRLE